jgi:hypothetical protein
VEYAEPGDSDAGMLAAERLDRSEEPLGGRLRTTGEAKVLCNLSWAGVSLMDGVPIFLAFSVLSGVLRSVWRVRPASAGVPERRWESGGWWFIVGSGAWLCAYAMLLAREDSEERVGGGVGVAVVFEFESFVLL